jgi:hypothetical protein
LGPPNARIEEYNQLLLKANRITEFKKDIGVMVCQVTRENLCSGNRIQNSPIQNRAGVGKILPRSSLVRFLVLIEICYRRLYGIGVLGVISLIGKEDLSLQLSLPT